MLQGDTSGNKSDLNSKQAGFESYPSYGLTWLGYWKVLLRHSSQILEWALC